MKLNSIQMKILMLSLPAMAQLFFKTSIGMVDKLMLGQLGEASIAGVGTANNLIYMMIMIFSAVGFGVGILSAQCVGGKNYKDLRKLFASSTTLSLFAGFIMAICFFLFAKDMIVVMGADKSIVESGTIYLKIVAFRMIPMIMTIVLTAFFRAFNDNKTPMYISFIALSLNVTLNYIFIIKLEKGVYGAGLATLISTYFELFIMLLVLKNREKRYRLSFKSLLRYKKEMTLKIFNIGWPMSLDTIIWRFSSLVIASMILRLGVSEAGVYEIVQMIQSVIYVPIGGITAIIAVLVGQNLGKGNYEEAKQLIKEAVKIAIVIVLGIALLSTISSSFLPKMFNFTQESKIMARNILLFIGFLQINVVFTSIYPNVLRAGGDVKIIILISSSSIWLVSIPLVYLLGIKMGFGLYGIIIAYNIGEFLKAYIFYKRIKQGKWLKKII